MWRELIRALFQAGLPVALASYVLVWWALKNDYLGNASGLGDMEREFKRLSKNKKKNGKNGNGKALRRGARKLLGAEPEESEAPAGKMNPVHNKWLAFGGGFYGVVALLTYAVVELGEIRDFIARYDGFFSMISQFSFNMLIEVIVNAFVNFIVAIAWPVYWMSDISGPYIWVWFAVAYAGYWLGGNLALRHVQRGD
jgi:hypothetical protein